MSAANNTANALPAVSPTAPGTNHPSFSNGDGDIIVADDVSLLEVFRDDLLRKD